MSSNSNSQIKKLRRRDNLNRLKGEKDDFYYNKGIILKYPIEDFINKNLKI